MRPLEELGRAVAREQDRHLRGAAGYANVRASLATASPRRQRSNRPLAVAGVVIAAAAAVWLWLVPRPLSLHHAGAELRGALATRVEAESSEIPLRFSDGSELFLERQSRVDIVRVENSAVDLTLNHGRLRAAIESAGRTRWNIASGPLAVVVTGTRFAVSWDPERQRFALDVNEGAVEVSVPRVGTRRKVGGGESFVVDCLATPAACGVDVASHARPTPSPSGTSGSAPSRAEAKAAPSSSASAQPKAASWRELAREGKYKEALALIPDFQAACAAAGPDELMDLANVARAAGSGSNAQVALQGLRSRYPGHRRASEAAFQLGRMAFDGQGNYAAAAQWFSTYLAEQPGGAFARDALGRLLECHHRSGATAAAESVARRYLASYPSGPHAPLARSIASED